MDQQRYFACQRNLFKVILVIVRFHQVDIVKSVIALQRLGDVQNFHGVLGKKAMQVIHGVFLHIFRAILPA